VTSPPAPEGKHRRPVTRWVVRGVLFAALVAGVFGLLPRLGGLRHDAASLRHARPVFVAAAIVAQTVSLACYAALCGRLRGGEHRQRHPHHPGGLGVIEVTLVGITVGFGAPRATAVIAVLGYRVVNYWLPLLPGALAYLRLRLSLNAAGKARPSTPPAG
jgi:uncharacterized membrane protein YbhN (UPF0104 family)